MSLIDNTKLSAEERREMLKTFVPKRLGAIVFAQILAMAKNQKETMKFLWEHPGGLSPQDVCDALGERASLAFAAHQEFTQFIIGLCRANGVDVFGFVPGGATVTLFDAQTPEDRQRFEVSLQLPTYRFVLETDGSVTITSEPYLS